MKCNRPRKPLSMMCMLIVALMMVVSVSSRTAYSHNSRSTEDTVRIKRAKFFSIPRADKVAVWEAERARQRGKWELRRHKLASGGFYVRPIELSSDTMLEFPFKVREPISIMVYPLWWRHGERLPARRFPYPLERKPGPDAIATWRKNLLFFTAPANGRIGVFDITAKRVIKAVDIGGYITDLVVDGEFDKVYIADAIGNRVVVLDPRHLRVSNEIKVPACPWSLALSDGILYVACRDGRAVVAIDSLFERVIAQAQLPMPALHVEVHGERVIVWLEPRVFDVAKLQTIKPEREQYAFGRRTGAEYGPRRKPGWKRFYCAGAHTIRIETLTEKGWTRKLLDVKQVTGAPKSVTQLPQPLRDTPGPDALCIYGSRLFFTSPSTGRVGVIDIAKERVERALDIGGYLSDIVADPLRGRVYVADAIGNRIVTIDAQQLKVLNSIRVPALPVALEMFTPPGFLRGCAPMLFAGCWRAKSVIGIDPAQSKITWQSNLPIEPRYLCVVTPPNPGWWPLIPVDRIQLEALRTRLAVASMPIAFTKRELKFVEPAHVAPRFGRRSEVIQELGGGARRVIGVDNYHTIRVALYDGQGRMLSEDWVDVTNVTDPQLRSEPQPLTPLDKPGTVTIALDDGPEYHWRREIWMTPKQGILLVNETDEFWRWNAPVFSLPAGEHVIRVRAYSGYAQLDGLRIRRTLKGRLRMRIYGHQPMEMLPMRYRSVFYYDEPVELRVELKNLLPISQ
ncbi:MAG TPA: hypothetical protein EYP10_11525, partial [Armatimonadetes bacterium]|nr:hypothetical protein [Armatimonadota bacterium]